MAPPGSSRPSLTYTDQTLEALLPAITPCLNFSNGWKAVIRSSRLNDASVPPSRHASCAPGSAIGCLGYRFHICDFVHQCLDLEVSHEA
jgi:hypothetical protein